MQPPRSSMCVIPILTLSYLCLVFSTSLFSPQSQVYRAEFENKPPLVYGVNELKLIWLDSDDAIRRKIHEISAAGIHRIRVLGDAPFEKLSVILQYCQDDNIDVLVEIPLTSLVYYKTGESIRGKVPFIWPSPAISDLDLHLFTSKWASVIKNMNSLELKIRVAFEIGNEFNSSAFNADLPLISGGGKVITRDSDLATIAPMFLTGLRKVVQAAKALKCILADSRTLKTSVVLSGGLVRPSDGWIKTSEATIIAPNLVLSHIVNMDSPSYFDAYGFHAYPQIIAHSSITDSIQIDRYISSDVRPLFPLLPSGKSLWITEWGFNRSLIASRDRYMQLFISNLKKLAVSNVGPDFVYDWDEDIDYDIAPLFPRNVPQNQASALNPGRNDFWRSDTTAICSNL